MAVAEPKAMKTSGRAIRGAATVVGDFAAIASGRLGSAILSFATVLLATRLLGPVKYGVVATVGIVANLVFIASTSWSGISVRRYGREVFESGKSMASVTWNRALIGAPLVTLAIVTIVALKLLNALPSVITWPLVWVAVGTGIATIIVDHWVCLLETGGRMKTSAGSQLLAQALYVVSLGALILLGRHPSALTVLSLSLGTTAALALAVIPMVWRIGIWPFTGDWTLLRRMLWLSLPVIGLTVSQYVISSVDIIVLRMFRSGSDVGVYAVAYQAYTVLSASAVAATAVLLPLFVSLQMAGRLDLVARYFERFLPQVVFALAVLGGLALPLLPYLVPIVFGHGFAAAAHPLAVLCLALLFLYAAYLVAPILTLHEQTRATAIFNAAAAVINVALDLLLLGVFHMGIIAPAIATAAAIGFAFLAFYARGRRLVSVAERVNPFILAPFVAGLAPTLLLSRLAGALVGIGAVAACAAAVVIWRSPISEQDKELIDKLSLPPVVKRAIQRTISLLGA